MARQVDKHDLAVLTLDSRNTYLVDLGWQLACSLCHPVLHIDSSLVGICTQLEKDSYGKRPIIGRG